MPKMSDHDEFLNSTMVENGDIIVLLNEGTFKEPEETGLQRTVFHINVGLPDQRKKIWGMNKTTRRRLAKAFGDDSATWVNKRVRLEITTQNVMGEMRDVLWGHPVEGDSKTNQSKISKQAPAESSAKNADGIRAKIMKAKPSLTDEAVEKLIAEEIEQAGGLLTEEAATYLVAKELNVKLGT